MSFTTVQYYICDTCGKKFANYDEAVAHDKECNKCLKCKHMYYVYGVDMTCAYSHKCNHPNWEHFKENK